jgi:hypothetical protein
MRFYYETLTSILAKGKIANFIILDGDPSSDIENTHDFFTGFARAVKLFQ